MKDHTNAITEEVPVPTRLCARCERVIPADAGTCMYCGAFQLQHVPEVPVEVSSGTSSRWLGILVVFYGIDLIVCTGVNFLNDFRGLEWVLITQSVLGALTLIFLVLLWKDLRPLLQWQSFSMAKALVYGVAAIVFAVFVNIAIIWLNKSIFDQHVYYYHSFRHLPYPRLAMILLVALLPAVFEELSYRGIILHSLFALAEERQAVFISAFLFAVIHMSFISFFWLLPFAVWLGNVRWKEKTVWYGVLIHFCFNATACIFEFYDLHLLV